MKGASFCQTRLKLSWRVNECKPLDTGGAEASDALHALITHAAEARARRQGLTLVHFSAQLKRFLRDRGYI